MIDRDTLRMVLDSYLSGEVTRGEISNWAYDIITRQGENEDPLVNEILYNLVSFHDVGMIFDKYRPNREKLEFLAHWLDNEGDHTWDQYNAMFDSGKLM
ncbi:MAG: hypothetical protein CVU89_07390 [Firmicutes bacterium HGW-Firmicutes-14]|nr:MAG: hypothetical protein CVU89_07390 [Firmicutes bacterium HGW-Firmicutes-14]